VPFIGGRETKRARVIIEAYRARLASDQRVSADDAISCHEANLIVAKDLENRVRSIQTLATLRSRATLPTAVHALVTVSATWPTSDSVDLAWMLADALRDVL